MDWQTLFNWAGGIATAALGWFARTLYYAVHELKRDLADMRVEVARDYVTKAEVTRIEDKIDAGFQRVYDRLDRLTERK